MDVHDGSHVRLDVNVTDSEALSPDGTKLAAVGMTRGIDGLLGLLLTSTQDSRSEVIIVDEKGQLYFSWSRDSQYLYYWATSWDSAGAWLRRYDTSNGTIINVIDGASVMKALGFNPSDDPSGYPYLHFAVSPDEKMIVFWNRDFKLVELLK